MALDTAYFPRRSSRKLERSDLIGQLAYWFAAAAMVTVTFNAVRVSTHVTLSDVFLVATALVLLVSVAMGKPTGVVLPLWLIGSLIILGLAALVASFASAHPFQSAATAAELIAGMALTPIVILGVSRTYKDVLGLADYWLASCAVNGAVAVSDSAHWTGIGRWLTPINYWDRVPGLTVHPTPLAIACGMALPVAAYRLISAHSPLQRLGYGIGSLAIALGLLVSGSRAPLVASLVATAILPLINRGQRWRAIGWIGAVAAFLVVVAVAFAESTHHGLAAIQRITGAVSVAYSNNFRIENFRAAVADIASSPLIGHGFQLVRQAHNIYLQVFEAGGILAFIPFLVFLVCVVAIGWRLARSTWLPGDRRMLATALTLSVLVWLVAGLVEDRIFDRFIYVPIGLLLGLKYSSMRSALGAASFATRPALSGTTAVPSS
jgi:O-antigen ligase